MHNSYYLVVIALVLAVGSLITLFTADTISDPPTFVGGVIFSLFGGAVFGIGIVMLTYNEKRNNAARLRGNITRELGELLNSPKISNPFDVNNHILAGKIKEEEPTNRTDKLANDTEWFFRRKLSASRLALALVLTGGIVSIFGTISLIIGIISLFGF